MRCTLRNVIHWQELWAAEFRPNGGQESVAEERFPPVHKLGSRMQKTGHVERDLSSLAWRRLRYACRYSVVHESFFIFTDAAYSHYPGLSARNIEVVIIRIQACLCVGSFLAAR